jgi:flagellar biosynthetic protein FlhB
MSEPRDNSTEKPTQKRLMEAKSRGQFARAPEIGVVAGLLASYFAILVLAPQGASEVGLLGAKILGHLEKYQLDPDTVTAMVKPSVAVLFTLSMPPMIAAALAAILAGAGQTGFALTPKVLGFNMERLDPSEGFQRVFSKAGLVRMLVDLAKLVLVAWLIYGAVQRILADPIFYSPVPVARLGTFLMENGLRLLLRLAVAMTVIAALHYIYQRRKTEKDLMMSKHEVTEEMKEAMGDPKIKAAQRAMARRLAQKQMLAEVPVADVIVTNPTHYAVALKYERGKDAAPVLVAKGENLMAQRIKQIGREHGVPMVENKPVARSLFRFGKVGEPIPSQLYQAIAEILGYVYRTHRYYFHQLKMRRMSA